MYLNCMVEIPGNQTGISKKKIKGTAYIYYEHGIRYDPAKRLTSPNAQRLGSRAIWKKIQFQRFPERKEEAIKGRLYDAYRRSGKSVDFIIDFIENADDEDDYWA